MSKHTLGPWAVVGGGTIKSGDLSIGEAYIYDENDYDYNPKSDDARKKLPWMANARLMAAAPELLEFVEDVAEGLDTGGNPGHLEDAVENLEERAQRIIARIKGDE